MEDVRRQVARAQDDYARDVFRPDEIAAKVAALREQERGLHARMEAVREARTHAARSAAETEDTRRLLRSLAQRARTATPDTRADVLRTLVRSTRASWADDGAVRLNVTYGFDAPALAVIPATDIGSEDQHKRALSREHVLAAPSSRAVDRLSSSRLGSPNTSREIEP